MGGASFPESILKTMALMLKDGKFESKSAGNKQRGSIKIDLGKKPKAMDIRVESDDPDAKPQTIKCIYQVEKKKLVVVYALRGDRPSEFKSTKENGWLLIEYARGDKASGNATDKK